MGKVQDYLEKKRIEKEGLPKMYVVKSTREGVEKPVERQIVTKSVGSQYTDYKLDDKGFPYRLRLIHGDTSDLDEGYGSGFGDLWDWSYFSTLNKEEADAWYEEETRRVKYKYQIRIPEKDKMIRVFDKHDHLVGEFDYIDSLAFRLSLLEDGYTGGYFIENEHGGKDEIDKFACSYTNGFDIVGKLLNKIVVKQMDLRKKEWELEQLNKKENDNTGTSKG